MIRTLKLINGDGSGDGYGDGDGYGYGTGYGSGSNIQKILKMEDI